MPATGVKFLMLFNDNGQTIGEAHVYINASQLASAVQPCYDLMQARMKIMGAGVTAIAGRLSLLGSTRNVDTLDPIKLSTYTPGAAKYFTTDLQVENNNPDQGNACILCRKRAGGLYAGSLSLAGVPDAVLGSGNEPLRLDTVPGFKDDLVAYFNRLTMGGVWGMVVRAPNAGATVAQQVVDMLAPSDLVGVVVNGGGPTYTGGQFVKLTGFRRTNPAYASLNGKWQVAFASAGPSPGQFTYYLRGTTGIPVSQQIVTKMGTIALVDNQVQAYTEIEVVRAGTHKRGNRSLVPAARRLVRKKIFQ